MYVNMFAAKNSLAQVINNICSTKLSSIFVKVVDSVGQISKIKLQFVVLLILNLDIKLFHKDFRKKNNCEGYLKDIFNKLIFSLIELFEYCLLILHKKYKK